MANEIQAKPSNAKRTLGSLILTVAFVAAPFLAAGTINYWEAWLFIAVFSICTTITTLYLLKHDRALLERRIKAGPTAEKRPAQRIIMLFISISFFSLLIVSGIDHRESWSHTPAVIAFIGDALVALGYYVFHRVFQENSFASSTIEIAEGHKVISTGPYSIVRHPMYFGALIFLLGIPLALRSMWASAILIPSLPLLIWRIFDEEKMLRQELNGYVDYCSKVKYRLIPGVF